MFCLISGSTRLHEIPKSTAQPSRRPSFVGDPLITHAEEEEGVAAAAAPLVVWLLAFSLASVWNVLYAVFLLWKNETWARYTWMGWADLVRKIRNVRAARSSAICCAVGGGSYFYLWLLCVLRVAARWKAAGFSVVVFSPHLLVIWWPTPEASRRSCARARLPRKHEESFLSAQPRSEYR